jgi:hypothetical protein
MGYTNTVMTIAILILDGLIGTKTGPSLAFRRFESQVMALGVFKSLAS